MNITVGIIGGGPAGLSAALYLRQIGVQAIVFEKSSNAEYRAGEHISPECKPLLQKLKIPESIVRDNAAPCYAVSGTWGDDKLFSNDSIFNVYGDGFILSRPDFDNALLVFAKSSGVVIKANMRVTDISKINEKWCIRYKGNTGNSAVLTDYILDASGKSTKNFNQLVTKKAKYDDLIGITCLCKDRRTRAPARASIHIEATKMGWWYTAIRRDNMLVATFMTDADIYRKNIEKEERLWECINTSINTKSIILKYKKIDKIFVSPAQSQMHTKMADDFFLAIGDAAWSVDPLSSQGIYNALSMGIDAAKSIFAHANGSVLALNEYQRKHTNLFYKYLSEKAYYYRLEKRWSENIFWHRRHAMNWMDIPIKIDPGSKVRANKKNIDINTIRPITPSIDFDLLLDIMENSPVASCAVLSYKKRAMTQVEDREVIVAIQELSSHSM